MKIQILGTGCPKCKKLAENTAAALQEAGVSAEIEKVSEVAEIAKFKVLFTPALAIDGEVKVAGKVPDVKKLVEIIKAAAG
ncbi:MAG: thioredoxin family protein [Armatimonadetes bacterium]|nr:thioredoxin family protein [Armatimonadota bacterium]